MKNQTISNYNLQHEIGEGGMAEVWYAENRIGKKAAIKIIKKELALLPEILTRFENEAKVMVTLDHPNIRQVYDYGVIDGRSCIIMEYLEGADLSVRLKNGERFSKEQLAEWWNQLVDALNYTHDKGVVHRDIKPSNVFLSNDGKIKLLDFGIAKVKGALTITQTGSRMGTLLYMSPEQVKDSKYVDYRTDVYSLAVTFYHLLSGMAPYDNTKSSEFEIQTKIVTEALQLDKLPADWRTFLGPYLKKDAEERPKLANFSTNTQPQPWPQPPPKLDPGTEIKKPTPPPVTPPQPAKVKNYTPYWLLAAAVVIIIVLLIVNSNNNAEKERMAEQQRTEQSERQQLEEQSAWNTAKNTNTKAAYEKYLRDYPQGRYVSDANNKIKDTNKKKEVIFEGEIFTVVESGPEFPGGDEQMILFIANNIKYPPIARESGIQGRVFVNFVVEPNGSVTNAKVLRGIGGGCDEEAIRLVESMPKWIPGRQHGMAVRVSLNLPIRFTLN